MYLEDFISYIKSEKRFSKHTITSYETDLNQFVNYIEAEGQIKNPKDVSFKLIRNWISSLLENNLKSTSVNRKISSLKSYYKFLLVSNYVDTNPTLKLISPKSSKRLPVFVEKDNMDSLFDKDFFEDNDFKKAESHGYNHDKMLEHSDFKPKSPNIHFIYIDLRI